MLKKEDTGRGDPDAVLDEGTRGPVIPWTSMPHDPWIGTILAGKYRIERLLARGSVGDVYCATHVGTSRVVAVKIVRETLDHGKIALQRIQIEARALGRLRHPHIVNVTDSGDVEVNGELAAFLVMELVEGESLASFLEREPRPPLPLVADLVEQIAAALDAAHDRGIVHRDLHPGNVLLDPRADGGIHARVNNFHLANLAGLSGAVRMTAPGAIYAPDGMNDHEAAYSCLPPEQLRGIQSPDSRWDIYALSAITYLMLAVEPPFRGDTVMALLGQILFDEARPLGELRPDVSPAVADAIHAALAKLQAVCAIPILST